MPSIALLLLLFFVQSEIPFKAKEEFEIKLDYQFRERGQYATNTLVYGEKPREVDGRTTKSVLPYVVLKLKLLKLNNEDRMTVDTNIRTNYLVRKHIEAGKDYLLDLGFTNDMKDQISANEYTVLLLSPEKKPVSKIIIFVDKDGTFKVNGETRGRF